MGARRTIRRVNLRPSYVVMTLGMMVGAFAVPVALSGQEPGATSVLVSLLCFAIVLFLFPHEWKRDRRAASMFGLAILAVGFIVSLAIVGIMEPFKEAILVAAASLASGLWLSRVLWQEYHFHDLLPSWIDAQFEASAIFEDDGVAWVLSRGTGPDSAPDVCVYLQNNIEAARSVTVSLKDESGFVLRSGALLLPELPVVELLPRARATVRVPCFWAPDRKVSSATLYCGIRANGPLARRNRRQRSGPGPVPIPKWLALLGPLGGILIWRRGGVFLTLRRPEQVDPASTFLAAEVRIFEEAQF